MRANRVKIPEQNSGTHTVFFSKVGQDLFSHLLGSAIGRFRFLVGDSSVTGYCIRVAINGAGRRKNKIRDIKFFYAFKQG